MLTAILAISQDGYTAEGPKDDMSWTGPDDKTIFRLYTMASPVLGVGAGTLSVMPKSLTGRVLARLSTKDKTGMTLADFAERHPQGMVIGGPRLVVEGIRSGLITTLILCRNKVVMGEAGPTGYYYTRMALQDAMTFSEGAWYQQPSVRFGSVTVEVYRV